MFRSPGKWNARNRTTSALDAMGERRSISVRSEDWVALDGMPLGMAVTRASRPISSQASSAQWWANHRSAGRVHPGSCLLSSVAPRRVSHRMRGHTRDICRASSSLRDRGASILRERWTRLEKTRSDEAWSWKASADAISESRLQRRRKSNARRTVAGRLCESVKMRNAAVCRQGVRE
ncbi:hypothetical protein K523DRAFT_393983 [Schizophyllum commune Tattone D]|nr:hypothetical protein K523DRAFT_393983 [Schizophyllum commune Tattone D]